MAVSDIVTHRHIVRSPREVEHAMTLDQFKSGDGIKVAEIFQEVCRACEVIMSIKQIAVYVGRLTELIDFFSDILRVTSSDRYRKVD